MTWLNYIFIQMHTLWLDESNESTHVRLRSIGRVAACLYVNVISIIFIIIIKRYPMIRCQPRIDSFVEPITSGLNNYQLMFA